MTMVEVAAALEKWRTGRDMTPEDWAALRGPYPWCTAPGHGPIDLPAIIADHHPHREHDEQTDPPSAQEGWCQGCDEPWPCATVTLLRECREALAEAPDPMAGSDSGPNDRAAYQRRAALLARLAEPEVPA
jgi:hypothetical protein